MYLIKAWKQTRQLGSLCERWKVGGQVNPQGDSPRSPFGISIVGSTTGRSPATSQAGPGTSGGRDPQGGYPGWLSDVDQMQK